MGIYRRASDRAGNPVKGEITRQKILETGRELLQTRSFHGFSFQDIADSVGIRKASLYRYFPSKDALAVTLLRQYREAFQAFTQLVEGRPSIEQFDEYFTILADLLQAGERICPGNAFVAGWGRLNEPIRREVNTLIEAHRNWLSASIRRGRESGELRSFAGTVEDEANWIYATLQGALLMARVSGKRDDFIRITRTLTSALKAS